MAYQQYYWTDIRDRLAERYDEKPFWTDEQALLAFNEALRFWNLLTSRWQVTVTQPTVARQFFCTVSSTLLWRARVAFNGYPLSVSNRFDLNNARYAWRTEATINVPPQPIVWAPISLQTFYLWPADAIGGNTLTIAGVAATPVLTYDAGFVDIGEDHLDLLIGYSLHRLTFVKGGTFFQATGDLYRQLLVSAAEENDQIKTSEVYRRIVQGDEARGLKRLRGGQTRIDAVAGRS